MSVNRSESNKPIQLKSWRDYPDMNVSLGNMRHNLTGGWRFIKPIYEDKVPACQHACPAGNDIEAWIKLVQKGDYEKAYWYLKQEQPFPAVLGRVCFQFCESACNREPLDACIGIRDLERFVGDQMTGAAPPPDLPEMHDKTLAVVGSGPAGMSAAYFARRLGFKVTIFEAMPLLGGILRVGIPAYRLPRDIIDNEFEALKKMGIELKTDTPVGDSISLQALADTFDYIFLATGVHGSRKLDIPGEIGTPAVMSGLEMLKRVASGEQMDLGRRVAVIGGGNTAIDAARTAVRLGSRVTIVYRRSQNEMPAHVDEIREAIEEGVELITLAAPEEIRLKKDGAIERLICCRMELGAPDESGRRRPVKKEGALFDLEVDCVLTAIGEIPLFEYLEKAIDTKDNVIAVGEDMRVSTNIRSRARIYAGGDVVPVAHTVVHAVATGKRAAIAMDCDRLNKDVSAVFNDIALGGGSGVSFTRYSGLTPVNSVRQHLGKVVDSAQIVYDYFEKAQAVRSDIEGPDSRKSHFSAYSRTLTEDEARSESERCIHCGRCTECDNCLIFCPDMSIGLKDPEAFGYRLDYDYCKGCGVCVNECPRSAMTMIDEDATVEESKH